MTWCTLRVSEQTMVSTSGPFCPLSSPSGRSIFARIMQKEYFGGRVNSNREIEQPLKVRFVLHPCRRAPAKKKERSACCGVLLYFFCSPVIIPDCICAWFCLMAHFPTLFRVFICLHLKVSPKSGQAHSPNQLITAEWHPQQSKLQDFQKWIQTFWWQEHLQFHKQQVLQLMLQTYLSQRSWKMKDRAPKEMDQALPVPFQALILTMIVMLLGLVSLL